MESIALLARLSLRSVFRQPRRSLVLFLAVAFCTSMMFFSAAVIRGLEAGMTEDAIQSLTGNLKLRSDAFDADPGLGNAFVAPPALAALGDVSTSLRSTTRLVLPVAIRSEHRTMGIQLAGVDMADELEWSFLRDAVIEGKTFAGTESTGLLIGRELMERLQTRLGKRVVLLAEDIDGYGAEFGLRVIGVYDTPIGGLETTYAFIGRSTLQSRVGAERVSDVAIYVVGRPTPGIAEHAAIADRLRSLDRVTTSGVGPVELIPATWDEVRPDLAIMSVFADAVVVIWSVIMLMALSFGLINAMLSAVLERTREIGMMGVLGMNRWQVLGEVLLEGFWLVTTGLVVGTLAGIALIMLLSDGIDLSAFSEGLAQIGAPDRLVPTLTVDDGVTLVSMVLLLGLLATLYPAYRASRIPALAALRGG